MNRTIAAWHRLVENRDVAGLDVLLADDATFHSPILHKPQVGKALTRFYLTAALDVLCNSSFRYVREVIDEDNAALEFVAEIDGITVNGVDLITWNEAGDIVDFKVMLRPLKAVHLIQQRMATELQAMTSG